MKIKEYIQNHSKIKNVLYRFIMHPIKTRPNWWIRLFMPFYTKRGRKSIIYKSVRKDITPFNNFSLGDYSIIEDWSCINNAVGDVIIGSNSRIGLHNTVIGPIIIGNHVNIAQGVVLSGMNHSYKDSSKRIDEQKVITSPIIIEDDVWIGANCVILPGVKVGRHSVIGAGSVVTKDIPSYSLAVGNPARITKSLLDK